jgi:dihydropteroate synthase
MNFNARLMNITDVNQVKSLLMEISCDEVGINIMVNKAVFKAIKLEKIPTKAANLLKQTFLAKGGEVAVARGTADLSIDWTDVFIFATLKQYRLALSQLKSQPWGLPQVAEAIEIVLKTDENFPARSYRWPGCSLDVEKGRTLIMGILNITPDSFSDGGRFNQLDAALHHLETMINDGADIIDMGAESTRPYGSTEISADEELNRLVPVLEKVLQYSSVPVSIDTYKPIVAREALRIGAHIINDIWGLQYDAEMAKVIAEYDAPVVVMHNRTGSDYDKDIMSEICHFLRNSIDIAVRAGIDPQKIIVDPGIGFGKTPNHNLTVMSRLEELRSLGYPLLLGTSRKRFIGEVLGTPVDDRIEGTSATVALGIAKGANIIRVHDVKSMVRTAKMADALLRGSIHD